MSLAQLPPNKPNVAAVAEGALVKKLLRLRKAELAKALASFEPRAIEAALNEDLPSARAISLSKDHVERAGRRRTFQKCKAVFNDRMSVVDCTMRNRGDSGFLVETANSLSIPERFELRTQLSDERFAVRVVWRNRGQMGLAID